MSNKENIYGRLPLFLQNLIISYKGYEFENKRVNKSLALEHYKFLLESQFWSEEQILRYQTLMLQNILKEAFLNVPYYIELSKNTNLDYRDIKTLEDLKYLPILEKKHIRGNEQQFIHKNIKSRNLLRTNTSGTTGTPMKLYYTKNSFSMRWAFELRLRKWAKLDNIYHPRRVQFTGRDIVPNNWKNNVIWRYNKPSNTLHCSTSHINQKTVKHLSKAIKDFQPEFIDGYPSAISTLARLCIEKGYLLPKVNAVRVSAETLFDEDRIVIEEAFQAKVFNQYGSSESSCFGCDNEHGEMLIHPEFGVFETKDFKNTGEEVREVITTSFMNPNMPLIRYRLGDLVKIGKKNSSSHGKNFLHIESVVGRTDDILFIPNIGFIGRLDPVFKGIEGIIEAQILLEKNNVMIVKIVPNDDFTKYQKKEFLNNIRKKVGNSINIKFSYVKEIERGPNGKFKSVVDNTNQS